MSFAPVRLPTVRDKLTAYWRQPMAAQVISQAPAHFPVNLPGADCGRPDVFARQGPKPPIHHARSFCDRIAGALDDADLYWVSDEFAQLAKESAEVLPDLSFLPEELPSPAGLLTWQTPIADFNHGGVRPGIASNVEVTAVSWFTIADSGIWLTLYCDPKQVMPGAPQHRIKTMIGALMPLAPGGGAEFGRYAANAMPTTNNMIGRVMATWFLLKQPGVADATDAPTDAQLRKKYDRAQRRWPNVRVINLRRRPTPEVYTAPDDSDEEPRREPTHSSTVGPHWRTYWTGPGRTVRDRRYILEHTRRPDLPPGPPKPPTVKTLR
jgi:hypothetical protein